MRTSASACRSPAPVTTKGPPSTWRSPPRCARTASPIPTLSARSAPPAKRASARRNEKLATVANLSERYDVALLDLDGVVYIGGNPIPGAPAALQRAKNHGMRLAYVTNNASRTPAAVAAMLNDMDVPAAESDVVSSAQAAARLLAEKLPHNAPVLVIGS